MLDFIPKLENSIRQLVAGFEIETSRYRVVSAYYKQTRRASFSETKKGLILWFTDEAENGYYKYIADGALSFMELKDKNPRAIEEFKAKEKKLRATIETLEKEKDTLLGEFSALKRQKTLLEREKQRLFSELKKRQIVVKTFRLDLDGVPIIRNDALVPDDVQKVLIRTTDEKVRAQGAVRRIISKYLEPALAKIQKRTDELEAQLGTRGNKSLENKIAILEDTLENLVTEIGFDPTKHSKTDLQFGRYWSNFLNLLRSSMTDQTALRTGKYITQMQRFGNFYRFKQNRLRVIFKLIPEAPMNYFHILDITLRDDDTYSNQKILKLNMDSERQWLRDQSRYQNSEDD